MADKNFDIYFGKDGGSSAYTYGFDTTSCQNTKDVIFNFEQQPQDNWCTFSKSNGVITISANASTSENERSAIIDIKHGSTDICGHFNITQANGCNCGNLSIPSTINSIPSTGMSVNDELGTYTITNNCNKASYTAILVEDEAGTQYPVELDGNSSGIVRLKRAIPKAERDDDTKYFTLKFFYNGVHCDKLDIPLEQISIPCSCESIEYFVRSLKRTFPLSGTGEDYAILASGDTNGCGYLSAITTTEMLDNNGELVIEQKGEYQYLFKGKVLPYTGEYNYRTADVRLFFKKKDETEFKDCERSIFLVQSDCYNSCSKKMSVTGRTASHPIEVPCNGDSSNTYRVATVPTYSYSDKCRNELYNTYGISATTDADWITLDETFGTSISIEKVAKNNTNGPRDGIIHLIHIIDKDEYWNSGYICEEVDAHVHQPVCSYCDCESLHPDLRYSSQEVKYNQTGETLINEIEIDPLSCVGSFYPYSDGDEDAPTPNEGDYRAVFCGYSQQDHSWIDGDLYFRLNPNSNKYINVYAFINSINTSTSSSGDRLVHYYVGLEYYKNGMWQGGCNIGCMDNSYIRQLHNTCNCSEVKISIPSIIDPSNLNCEKSFYQIATAFYSECEDIKISGETCDAAGNPLTYNWCGIDNEHSSKGSLDVYLLANEGSYREAYVKAYLLKNNEPWCTNNAKIIKIGQKECECECSSYNLYVSTSGYESEFIDGSGRHVVAKVRKNTVECITVTAQTTQSYCDAYVESYNNEYDKVVVDIYDKGITTKVDVSVDIIAAKNTIEGTCDTDTIHIFILPKQQ